MWQTAVALFVAGVGAVLAALTLEAQDTTRDTTRIWLLAAILFVLASLFGLAAVAQAIRRRQRTGDLIQFADNWTAEIHPQAPFLIAHAGFFLRVGADYEEWRGRVLLYGKELPIVKTRRTPVPG